MKEDMVSPNLAVDPSGAMLSYPDLPTDPIEGKGFGMRALAYIIDTVILLVVDYGISFAVGATWAMIYLALGRQPVIDNQSSQCLSIIVAALLALIYFSLFEGLYGATIGKVLLGMRVVKSDGSPCDLKTAFHRGVWRYVDGIIFGAVAYSNMKPPLEQRLGDKKAGTVVIGAKDRLIRGSRDWSGFLVALLLFLGVEVVSATLLVATMIL